MVWDSTTRRSRRWRRSWKIDPHHPIVNLELGIIKNYRQEFDQAIRHLEAVSRVDDQIPDAYRRIVFAAYAAKGRLQDGVAALQRAIALDPSQPQSHYQLAQIYKKLGRMEEAQRELELFQKLDTQAREKKQRDAGDFLQGKPP